MIPIRTDSLYIPEQKGLDPISVLVSIYGESATRTAARVTVAVYEEAWTAYFGAMSGQWQQFLSKCDPPYLANALVRGSRSYGVKKVEKYVERIATAIIEALRPLAAAIADSAESQSGMGGGR